MVSEARVLWAIFEVWGILTIDLFATKPNKKCRLYCSGGGLSPGSLTDAFHLSWELEFLYALSPVLIILLVILKLKLDSAKLTFIAPAWPRQCWFSDLLTFISSASHTSSSPRTPDSASWSSFASSVQLPASHGVDAAWLEEE